MLLLLSVGLTSAHAYAASEEPLPAITRVATDQFHPGKVVWADLLTRDVGSAAAFYRSVFGWTMAQNAAGDIALATRSGEPVAAIASYSEEAADGEALWVASISVDDVDRSSAAVQRAGGEILDNPIDLPDRGRVAVARDPQGAVFMLLRATGGDPPDTPPMSNAWVWAELWSSDHDAAAAFYEQVIGYRSVAIKDGAGRDHIVLGRDQAMRASVIETPLPDVMPNWLLYLQVDDLASTLRKVLDSGGEILLPPLKDGFNNDVAIVADPTGGVVALQQAGEEE